MAHRLAWFIVHGAIPSGEVDHINRDRLGNRIANLRDVSSNLNQRNAKLRKDNTSGLCGVSWSKRHQVWRAGARINGRAVYLGLFPAKLDAAAAAISFRLKNGFTETHGKSA